MGFRVVIQPNEAGHQSEQPPPQFIKPLVIFFHFSFPSCDASAAEPDIDVVIIGTSLTLNWGHQDSY